MHADICHNVIKRWYDNHDSLNITWNRLKRRHHVIASSRFTVDYTIEDAPVCNVASRVKLGSLSSQSWK
ncbi:hypothetical protein TNCV_317051 [Trichonephila clavipes]|nr:hypothetical protein TNCV_317051 [Trichonephila clavipes]